MLEQSVYIFYAVVISYAYSYGTAFQCAELSVNQRSAVQSASYRDIVFVEIIAYIRGRVVFEVERHYAGGLGRIQSHVLDLFETVEQFARQISGIERDFGKVLIRPFRACAQTYYARAVDGARFVSLGRNGGLRQAFAMRARSAVAYRE